MSISNARKTHVTPGVYTTETELTYSSKSIGITTLGLAGETLKGPAFQPIFIKDWETFTKYFGGTNTEHFKGSKFPKYELPYIAKDYLKDSGQLYVTRVLGLSGYNAGPAWVIKAVGTGVGNDMIVAIIRSRGKYVKTLGLEDNSGDCGPTFVFDKLIYDVEGADNLDIKPANVDKYGYKCGVGTITSGSAGNISVGPNNYGTFMLEGTTTNGQDFCYTVSFNPNHQDYIYNVIGQTPDDNSAPIYIEELYDVALEQLILSDDADNKITAISNSLEYFPNVPIRKTYDDVNSVLGIGGQSLNASYIGKRYLYTTKYSPNTAYVEETKDSDDITIYADKTTDSGDDGKIFVVKKTLDSNGQSLYRYHYESWKTKPEQVSINEFVKVVDEGLFYTKITNGNVERVIGDLNNYKEPYRHAETPWVVSEIKGNYGDNNVTRLFKFHTIADGNASNKLAKVSIANIDPENLSFDVIVRDFNDIDENAKPLETFRKVNMNPDSPNYIAQRIGDIENIYPNKSSYILVEMNPEETGRFSFPAGFLGYPVRDLGNNTVKPYLAFNTYWDQEVKSRRQYFGVSDVSGIDDDIFTYKGVSAYSDGIETDGFHLDSRVNNINTTVDGENPDGKYTWQVVSPNNTLNGIEVPPMISNSEDIVNGIYEIKDLRKFTMTFYGGFDGWDIYREQRSNSDDFTYLRYKGDMEENFEVIKNNLDYNLPERAITSDYYAYLSAYLTFQNPIETDINLLATPGIDYVNNLMLVHEVIDMIEDDRQDTLYIVTTPDKEIGTNKILNVDDVVDNIKYSDINSSYACTYYPWARYMDVDNNKTIYLPVTRDIVRLIAETDNTSYSWFPPANERGTINCINSRRNFRMAETDVLYDSKINPILSFPQDGVKAWGIKTMLDGDSQLTRIGVRRMMIRMKSLISRAAKQLIFTPNDATAAKTFVSLITPILDDIKANRGISDYRLKVNDSIEARERRELPAQIWIKPIGMIEYIPIEFIITPEAVQWD